MVDMFEKAVRMKLRFAYRGKMTVEDLWDLPLGELDAIYGALRADQKAGNEESLLKKATKESTVRDLSIDIVKHIVETKLAEEEARKNRVAVKAQKEKIAAIIEKKQDEGLEQMSIDDLKKTMEQLDA